MFGDGIVNLLTWGSPESFIVRILHGCDGAVLPVQVAGDVGSIVWALMVIGKAGLIETINGISAVEVPFPEMVSTVGILSVLADGVKGPMGHVSRVAFPQRATSC